MDFENTVDHGSAVIFDADSGLCQYYVRIWVLNKIWIIDLSSAVVGMLIINEFIQIISFFHKKFIYTHVRDFY